MTGLDWVALTDRAVDPAELKQRLDLVVVCEALGVMLDEDPNTGKFHGICPFHDDQVASFDVYENQKGEQRVGCFACDFGNGHDVYAFIMAIKRCGFTEAVQAARAIADVSGATGPRVRRTPERAPIDLTPFVTGAIDRAAEDRAVIYSLLAEREIRTPADWLIDEFRLGVTPDGAGVVIPHLRTDGEIRGAKTRRANVDAHRPWQPRSVGGSNLDVLYGVWRDTGKRHVILVEGESDTWTAAYTLRGYECDVFGLPSGAAASPRKEWIDLLANRDVTLMFDADDGGRVGLRKWMPILGVARVAKLPEGYDVTAAAARDPNLVIKAMLHAMTVGSGIAPGLMEAPFGGYVRIGDDAQVPVANFVLRLVRTVEIEDEGSLFDVALPNGRVVNLPADELASDARFRGWCITHDLVWYGSTKDCQELLSMLLADAVFAPRMRGTRVAGWIDGCFVYPEPIGCIGGSGWAYVPPVADISIEKSLALNPGRWEPHVPALLTQMHQPDVVTPILGWIAAAPLRGTMKAFPILGVVGTAGAGKSTLLRELLATFGYSVNSTLTSTTPHGVSSFAAATNAAPVWFDEYRRGAREDARLRFDQVIRDAWESSASYKGGLEEQKQALTAIEARAPLVVTGEDVFSETSHLERMALIHLPLAGRRTDTLLLLREAARDGFGRAYLEWLAHRWQNDMLPVAPNIPDRPAHVRAVVRWGYELLNQFCQEMLGYELMPFDDTMMVDAHAQAASDPAILELIDACVQRFGRHGPIAWREPDGMTSVRLYDLVQAAKDLNIPLAGGPRATRAELEQRFDVTEVDDNSWGTVLQLRTKA